MRKLIESRPKHEIDICDVFLTLWRLYFSFTAADVLTVPSLLFNTRTYTLRECSSRRKCGSLCEAVSLVCLSKSLSEYFTHEIYGSS